MTTRKPVGEEKKELLGRLLEGVKGCQSRFGSRTELATEDDLSIRKLCLAFEQVFLHGLQKPSAQQASKGIWQITETLVSSKYETYRVANLLCHVPFGKKLGHRHHGIHHFEAYLNAEL